MSDMERTKRIIEAVDDACDDAYRRGWNEGTEEWRGKLAEQCGKTLAAHVQIGAILKRTAGAFNDRVFVGRDYTLENLERDLYAVIAPKPEA